MKLSSIEFPERREILAQAIRGIRRKRDLKVQDVAQRMNLPLRSYELFESGRGRFTFERIMAFAEATDSDPFAIMLTTSLRSADFAIACADTKLVLIVVMHLQSFYEERGADIAYLEPPNLIGGFERLFKELGAKLDDNEAFLRRWLENRPGSISLGSLSVRGLRRKKAS